MNVHNYANSPLPTVLDAAPLATPHRRRSIGPYRLDSRDLDSFNQLLARLGRRQAPLDSDQLVTAARELSVASPGDDAPACILQRLRWAESVAQMVRDPNWSPANDALAPAELVLDYVRGHEGLIPDWLPRVGRLDDAIVIDTAWQELAPEVLSYVDFRRLRHIEAELRGCEDTGFRFTRNEWERARRAEVELAAQKRRIRESSYLPAPCAMFRVH